MHENNEICKNPASIDPNQIVRNDQDDFTVNKDNTNLILNTLERT